MDQTVGRRAACRQRHVAGDQGQADIEMRFQRAAKDATAESIDDHGEIAKPSANRTSVISATQRWSRPVGRRPRARFSTTCEACGERIVTGTNGRLRYVKDNIAPDRCRPIPHRQRNEDLSAGTATGTSCQVMSGSRYQSRQNFTWGRLRTVASGARGIGFSG